MVIVTKESAHSRNKMEISVGGVNGSGADMFVIPCNFVAEVN